MFEFKRSDSGQWILLEVNARPWGSLPLPVSLGVDFPYRWYQLLVDGVELPPSAYRVGVYGRNLVPDLVAALAEAQAEGIHLLGRVMALGQRLFGLRKALIGWEKQDVLVADDRAPAFAEIASIWSGALGRAWRAAPGSRAIDEARARTLVRRVGRGKACVRVLFACQGNICRSPYAAAVLRQLGGDRVQVTSAGMMPRRDRPVPDLFRAQANHEGIDLDAHRSQWLDRDAADAADLIVVFDRVNVTALADRYPGRSGVTIMLGDLIGVGEIDDPVDGDAAFAAATYAKIRRGIEALVKLLSP
jgi:protein-tyrosine-phosphatase